MTEADTRPREADAGRSSKDRWVKLGMLAAVCGVMAGVYLIQLRPPSLPKGFGTDLEAALSAGRREKRPVLVLFMAKPINETTRWVLGDKSLKNPQVTRALSKGGHLCVAVKADRKLLNSPLAKEWGLKSAPALVVISPEGKPLARLGGRVGHADIERMLTQTATGGTEGR